MNMRIAVRILLLVFLVDLSACLTTPARDVSAPSASPSTTNGAGDTLTPDADTTEPAELAPVEIPTGSTVSSPDVPSGDRLLYFYPEPEPVIIPMPEPAVATPPKADPEKVAKAKPDTVAPPKTVQNKPPAPPVASKTPDKPAVAAAEAAAKEEVMPGIWVPEPVAPGATAVTAPLSPSRSTVLAVGQTLEVWYPGSGWVFLGDASAQNGLGYQTRKLDKTDTLFSFKALRSGDYTLTFSRFDVMQDAFSQDVLAVTVEGVSDKKVEKIRAPDYRMPAVSASGTDKGMPLTTMVSGKEVSDPLSVKAGSATTRSTTMSDEPSLTTGATEVLTNPATPSDPETILTQAKTALSSGNPKKSLELLDAFFTLAVNSLDEGWFLRGQAFEANGPERDIRKALAAYETLIAAYPDSQRWKDADGRIRFIKQFYLNIR